MKTDAFELNMRGLDQLTKALRGRLPSVRTGILGGSSRAKGSGNAQKAPSNAEIGAVHEFGSPARGIPSRSFLRVPITENLDKALQKNGVFTPDQAKKVLKESSVRSWLEQVAVVSEAVVLEAFDTQGDGKWAQWKDPNYQNNSGMILVDTAQLRNSITSEVKE